MVGLSPCFVCRGQYLVGISPYVVCDEQKWLVYHPVLSVMEVMVGISPSFCSVVDKNWLVYQPVCLS